MTTDPTTTPSTDTIFVIGSQKSGTTWLRNCYSHVVPISLDHEWYLPELYEAVEGHVRKYCGNLPPDVVDETLRQTVRGAWFAMIGTAVPGTKSDKSAYPCAVAKNAPIRHDLHTRAVTIARDNFPESRTVVIIRDPRAVYNSLIHFRRALKEKKRGPISALGHWLRSQGRKVDAGEFAKNWAIQNRMWIDDKPDCVVLYEDLKLDFEKSLRDIFTKTGIIHDDALINQIEEAEYDIGKQRHRQKALYRKGEIDDWKNYLTPAQVAAIHKEAGPLMQELGYEFS